MATRHTKQVNPSTTDNQRFGKQQPEHAHSVSRFLENATARVVPNTMITVDTRSMRVNCGRGKNGRGGRGVTDNRRTKPSQQQHTGSPRNLWEKNAVKTMVREPTGASALWDVKPKENCRQQKKQQC